MSLISTPLFKLNNTDNLEAGDVYKITNSKPINKVYDAAKGGVELLSDRAGGVRGIAESLTNLVRLKTAGATGKQLLEAGLGTFGTSSVGLLRTLGGGVIDKAAAFIDLDPSIVSKIKTTGGDVVQRMQYNGYEGISDFGNLVSLMGDLSGNPELAEYVNIGFESAVWGAALSDATGYGLYEYYDVVKEVVDPEVYRQALIFTLPSVAASGSLEAVKSIIAKLGVDVVITNKPDFVRVFLTQFKLPAPSPTDMSTYATELVTTLSSLDPGWYEYTRQVDEVIYDIKYMTTASADAKQLLDRHAVIGPLLQIAPWFPESSVDVVLREQFPLMVGVLT